MTIFSPTGSTDESYDFHSKARKRLLPESRFDVQYWMLGAGALDDPEGWYGEGGGRRVQDGEHMYTCGGLILIFGKTNTIM